MLYELEVCEVIQDRSPVGDKGTRSKFHAELRFIEQENGPAITFSGPTRLTREEAEADVDLVTTWNRHEYRRTTREHVKATGAVRSVPEPPK